MQLLMTLCLIHPTATNQVGLWLSIPQRGCLARGSLVDCEVLALALTDFIATCNRFEAHLHR